MKRKLLASLSLAVLLLSGCSAQEAAYVRVVNPTSANVTAVISGNVTVGNVPLPVTVGNTVNTTVSGDVNILQDAIMDVGNSSGTNIPVGGNFTGIGKSTLGVNAIQVSLNTDRNCIVYIQQSPNNINWDISDNFSYIASKGGNSWTVQAVNSYARVIVKNNNTADTTYFRLQTVLCPIVEALPRSLSSDGRTLTQSTLVDDYGFNVEFTPMGEMRVIEPTKLAGANFVGTTVDPNFWQLSSSNNGSTTQSSGQLFLTTNTTANGAAYVSSFRRARYVPSFSMRYRGILQVSSGAANNKRRWGVVDWSALPTITDGAFFELNGTTLSVVTMKGGVENRVSSGAFNGDYGSTYILDTNIRNYEIYWTNARVWFVIGQTIVHSMSFPAATWTNTTTFYLWMDNVNSSGATSTNTMSVRVASIDRLGPLQNAPTYKHISTATTTVCKYGAGTLHNIVVNSPTNSTITVYDNTAGSGTVIAVITMLPNSSPYSLPYVLDFYTGLTVVTSGTTDITLIYE